MKNLGIRNVRAFPFPSPPPSDALAAAEASLAYLGAIEHDAPRRRRRRSAPPKAPRRRRRGGDGGRRRRRRGRQATARPSPRWAGCSPIAVGVSARLGKLLLGGRQAGVLEYALPLVAMLAQPDPTDPNKRAAADADADAPAAVAPAAAANDGRWRCAFEAVCCT